MIDFHSHILWGMDDGSKSMEESLSMAAIALDEGIDTIVASPHCMDSADLNAFAMKVAEGCRQFRRALDDRGMDIRLVQGAEVYMDPAVLEMEGLDRLAVEGTMHIMVELPMWDIPLYADEFLYRLKLKGFVPIICHPERNMRIMAEPSILYRWVSSGALAQVNTGSITGFFGPHVRECVRRIVTHGLVHMLGSDAHSDGSRAPLMSGAVNILKRWIGPAGAEAITDIIPRDILKGGRGDIELPMECRPVKRRFFPFDWA